MNSEKYAQKLIKQYTKYEPTKLDELKALDKKVKRPAIVTSYILGIVGTLILGVGMCCSMDLFGKSLFALGIVVGIIGIAIVSINYFVYKKILNYRKDKYSEEIIAKSNELLNY